VNGIGMAGRTNHEKEVPFISNGSEQQQLVLNVLPFHRKRQRRK
jgi:hypothetical protein